MNSKIILGAAGIILWTIADIILSDIYGCDIGNWEWYVLWICAIGGTIFVRHALSDIF